MEQAPVRNTIIPNSNRRQSLFIMPILYSVPLNLLKNP
jgi:hypothetical protein